MINEKQFETRIEKLEQEINKDMDSNTHLELFDIHGNKVDAKILRMPQRFENGLADNGAEIICLCTMSDIIFGTEKYLDEIGRDNYKPDPDSVEKAYADKLFLRINGKISACETLFGMNSKALN